MAYIKKRYQGVNSEGAKGLESAFAEAWQSSNGDGFKDLLRTMMRKKSAELLPAVSERDRLVAATMFQWLGTDQGQEVLQKALGGGTLKVKTRAKFGRRGGR